MPAVQFVVEGGRSLNGSIRPSGNKNAALPIVAAALLSVNARLIAVSIQPNKAHIGGRGINTLTGADAVAPIGGAAFHDNKVWMKKAAPATARKS